MVQDSISIPDSLGRTIQLPHEIYVPVYGPGCGGVTYIAGEPPNESWQPGEFGPNTATVDLAALRLLEKLFVGEIESWDEIERMEYVVRAFVLHELVYWIQPAVLTVSRQTTHTGVTGSHESDLGNIVMPFKSTPPSIESFMKDTAARGYAVYSGYVYTKDGAALWGHDYWVRNYDLLRSASDDQREQLFKKSFEFDNYRDQYFLSPSCIGAGAYYGSVEDKQTESRLIESALAPVPDQILKQLDKSWGEVMGAGIGLKVRVGPLLAVVLDRASNRGEIADAILSIRNEFQKARAQLWDMYSNAINEKRLKVAVRELRKITGSVKSIIPASLPQQTPILNWFWNLTHLAVDVLTLNFPSALKNLGDLGLATNSEWRQVSVLDSSRLLAKSITDIEPTIPELLRKHLTRAEMESLNL